MEWLLLEDELFSRERQRSRKKRVASISPTHGPILPQSRRSSMRWLPQLPQMRQNLSNGCDSGASVQLVLRFGGARIAQPLE
jgi:hypothetical protein